MASPVGMTLRREQADERTAAALATITTALGTEPPERPARHREPIVNTTRHAEWTADLLERLAAAVSDADGAAVGDGRTIAELTDQLRETERRLQDAEQAAPADPIAALAAALRLPTAAASDLLDTLAAAVGRDDELTAADKGNLTRTINDAIAARLASESGEPDADGETDTPPTPPADGVGA